MTSHDIKRSIDAIWRIESAKIIAGLARIVRDVGLAEDLEQDTLIIALERWPISGIPDKPGAWLMATAKRRGWNIMDCNDPLGELIFTSELVQGA